MLGNRGRRTVRALVRFVGLMAAVYAMLLMVLQLCMTLPDDPMLRHAALAVPLIAAAAVGAALLQRSVASDAAHEGDCRADLAHGAAVPPSAPRLHRNRDGNER